MGTFRHRLAAGLALLLVLRLYTPVPGWILCPFLWLTSLPCPLCGLTRAFGSLAHGEWTRALEFHPLSPILAVFLAALVLGWRVPGFAARGIVSGVFLFGMVRIAILTL